MASFGKNSLQQYVPWLGGGGSADSSSTAASTSTAAADISVPELRSITSEAYALAKRGQVDQALSLLDKYEATYRDALNFWKCFIHCLNKHCWEGIKRKGGVHCTCDVAWWTAFDEHMTLLEDHSREACAPSTLEGILESGGSFDQYLLKVLRALRYFRVKRSMPRSDDEAAAVSALVTNQGASNSQAQAAISAINPKQVELLQQAEDAYAQKNYVQAVPLYHQALSFGPLTTFELNKAGWSVYHYIKGLLAGNNVQVLQIANLFGVYMQFNPQPVPDLLHSKMLSQLDLLCKGINTQLDPQKETKKHFHNYRDFSVLPLFQSMNAHVLRQEDLQVSKGDDGTEYAPLVIKLLRHVSKLELSRLKALEQKDKGRFVLTNAQIGQLNYLADAIAKYRQYDKSDNRIWLDYYLAQIYYRARRYQEALDAALLVTKQKSSEYWLWQSSAQCYAHLGAHSETDNLQKSAQWFAKAIMCNPQSSVLAGLYQKAIWSFDRCGYSALAAFLSAEASKEGEEPWGPCGSRSCLFVNSEADKSLLEKAKGSGGGGGDDDDDVPLTKDEVQEILQMLASESDGELYGDMHWYRCNLGEEFVQKPHAGGSGAGGGKEKKRRKLYVKYTGYDLPIAINVNDDPQFRALSPGAPLEARLEKSGEDSNGAPRFTVRQLRLREQNPESMWDLMPLCTAVVTSVDVENQKYHFRYNRDIHGTLLFRFLKINMPKGAPRIELPLKPGDAFATRFIAQPRKTFVASVCVDASYPTNRDPLPEALKYVRKG